MSLTIQELTGVGALGENAARDFFLETSLFLKRSGYAHYEVSNFAQGEEDECRHNWKYWRRAPYLGLGPSAHSFLHGVRWWNCRSTEQYCTALEQGQPAVEEDESLSAEQVSLEVLSLSLRTREGLPREQLCRHAGTETMLAELAGQGALREAGGRVTPTREGLLVADLLAALFS